jgi:hypothetical protein
MYVALMLDAFHIFFMLKVQDVATMSAAHLDID